MGERRLKEITTVLVTSESITDAMMYISNLAHSEIYLLLRYISDSKYEGMSFLSALMSFARDYLDSKKIAEETEEDNGE